MENIPYTQPYKKNFEKNLDIFCEYGITDYICSSIMHKVQLHFSNRIKKEMEEFTTEEEMLNSFLSKKNAKVTRGEYDEIWEEYRKVFLSMILKGCKKETYSAEDYPGMVYAMLSNSRKNHLERPQDVALYKQGNTALHIVAQRWNRGKVDLFTMMEVLQSDVDWNIKNNDGLTAYEIGDQEFKQISTIWRKVNGC